MTANLEVTIFTVVWTAKAEDPDVNSNLSYSIALVNCFDNNDLEIDSECQDRFEIVNDYSTQV